MFWNTRTWKLKKLARQAKEVFAMNSDLFTNIRLELNCDRNRTTYRGGQEIPYIAATNYELIKQVGFNAKDPYYEYRGCTSLFININSIMNIAESRGVDAEEFLLKVLSYIVICLQRNWDPTWHPNAA